jgi:hypothetical protein
MIDTVLIINGAKSTDDLTGLDIISEEYARAERVILVDKYGISKQVKYRVGENDQRVMYIDLDKLNL